MRKIIQIHFSPYHHSKNVLITIEIKQKCDRALAFVLHTIFCLGNEEDLHAGFLDIRFLFLVDDLPSERPHPGHIGEFDIPAPDLHRVFALDDVIL